jgi:hypothetical protein
MSVISAKSYQMNHSSFLQSKYYQIKIHFADLNNVTKSFGLEHTSTFNELKREILQELVRDNYLWSDSHSIYYNLIIHCQSRADESVKVVLPHESSEVISTVRSLEFNNTDNIIKIYLVDVRNYWTVAVRKRMTKAPSIASIASSPASNSTASGVYGRRNGIPASNTINPITAAMMPNELNFRLYSSSLIDELPKYKFYHTVQEGFFMELVNIASFQGKLQKRFEYSNRKCDVWK